MSFLWPQMLLALALVPLGVLAARAIDRRRRARASSFARPGAGHGSSDRRRRLRLGERVVGVLFVSATALCGPRAGAATGDDPDPSVGGHAHPHVRRLGQHVRHGCRRHTAGRCEGSGSRARRRAAGGRRHRGRGVQRRRDVGPDADGRRGRSWAMRSTAWSLPSARRSARASSCRSTRSRRSRAARRPSTTAIASRRRRRRPRHRCPAAIRRLRSSCSPTGRTRSRPTRRRPPMPRPIEASASIPSASARPTGTTLDIDGFTVHTQVDTAMLRYMADVTAGTSHLVEAVASSPPEGAMTAAIDADPIYAQPRGAADRRPGADRADIGRGGPRGPASRGRDDALALDLGASAMTRPADPIVPRVMR